MEHILASKIMKHGEENNILYPLQHGFRKGHSCETQLIEFVDDISKNLQEGQQTDILILDFAKAFDKVNHSLLIHKLQHYGIIGKSVRWIQNWLANRKQSVVIDGSTSDAVSVDSGVLQGSVLGPGLFLYYIKTNINSKTLRRRHNSVPDNIQQQLQKDLDKLGHWENEWCMKFHPDKCTVLRVTNKKKIIDAKYQLHGHTLESVTSAKYLGLTFTNKLQWAST